MNYEAFTAERLTRARQAEKDLIIRSSREVCGALSQAAADYLLALLYSERGEPEDVLIEKRLELAKGLNRFNRTEIAEVTRLFVGEMVSAIKAGEFSLQSDCK